MGIILMAALLWGSLALPSDGIKVFVDGTPVQFFDAEPSMMRGRVMVPLRGVFEALGAEVEWNGATQTVSARKEARRVELSLNNPRALVNGTEVLLDVPPSTLNDRVMVPLRFVGEAFGATVRWEAETRAVLIQTFPPPPDQTGTGPEQDSCSGPVWAIANAYQRPPRPPPERPPPPRPPP